MCNKSKRGKKRHNILMTEYQGVSFEKETQDVSECWHPAMLISLLFPSFKHTFRNYVHLKIYLYCQIDASLMKGMR